MLERSGEVPVGAAGPTDADGDAAHERGLQAVRDVQGHALAGFLPTEEEFGFVRMRVLYLATPLVKAPPGALVIPGLRLLLTKRLAHRRRGV